MDEFSSSLIQLLQNHASQTFAWCVLPNHYHALIEASELSKVLKAIGQLHGSTSHSWNGEDRSRGRKVFYRSADRAMRSERHFWATLNYVHHNPVHHGYVEQWADWPWSSAKDFLAQTDPAEAKRIWKEFPIDEYGKGWDDPDL